MPRQSDREPPPRRVRALAKLPVALRLPARGLSRPARSLSAPPPPCELEHFREFVHVPTLLRARRAARVEFRSLRSSPRKRGPSADR